MSWFILFSYIAFSYGISVIITQGEGPAGVFENIREWAEETNENLGLLFRCMLCMPTNVGIVFSLFNWFFVQTPITPFNQIFNGTDLWWLAAIMDGCFTGGICRFIFNIEDYIDKNTPIYE